jgi:Ca2+-binding EF-hand superfamily protein
MAVPPSPYLGRVRELQESFRLFDLDRNGTISATEVEQVMRMLGQALTRDQAISVIESYDVNGDGQIEFAEFLKHQLATLKGQPEALRAAFAAVDRDRDGFIERDELVAAVRLLWDGKLSDEQVAELVADLTGGTVQRVALRDLIHLVLREG